jgi:hypothetical protein
MSSVHRFLPFYLPIDVDRGARLTRFREPPSGEAKDRSSCSDNVVSEPSPLAFRTDALFLCSPNASTRAHCQLFSFAAIFQAIGIAVPAAPLSLCGT